MLPVRNSLRNYPPHRRPRTDRGGTVRSAVRGREPFQHEVHATHGQDGPARRMGDHAHLQFRILDPIRYLPEGAGDGWGLRALRRRAARLKRRLEQVDRAFMQWLGSA